MRSGVWRWLNTVPEFASTSRAQLRETMELPSLKHYRLRIAKVEGEITHGE
jgi:hypothetical protein